MTSTDTPMQVLVVVEDDPDVQFLVESIFSMDPRFNAADVAESAEAALEWSAQTTGPGVIVLDHGLAGSLTGLTAAQRLRELAPLAKPWLTHWLTPWLTRSTSRSTAREVGSSAHCAGGPAPPAWGYSSLPGRGAGGPAQRLSMLEGT